MLSACNGVATIVPTEANIGKLRFYETHEFALVSKLADLIIPRTETPGALDVNVPGFLDSLMAEWASADTQRGHRRALTEIENALGSSFAELPDDVAVPLLTQLDSTAYSGSGDHRGYRMVKGLITQAYFASEEGALSEEKWVATPGRWDPCVELI